MYIIKEHQDCFKFNLIFLEVSFVYNSNDSKYSLPIQILKSLLMSAKSCDWFLPTLPCSVLATL